jgi:hypothetical protein
MGNHNRKPVQTKSDKQAVENFKITEELQLLKNQNQRIAQEYQSLYQQALSFKDAALQNALSLSNLVREITGRLLAIKTDDCKETQKQIMNIVVDLNKTVVKEEKVVTNNDAKQD